MEDLGIDSEFWHGRRVLVTGHTGFKGGWLTILLKSMGAELTGLALPPITEPSLFKCAGVAEGIASYLVDVRDLVAVSDILMTARPEVVFHLAAQAIVSESYRDPVGTYSANIMGTVNVLESVRRCDGVRAVVVVTSDKCYENNEWVWGYRENEPMGGHDPYSSSKGCAELVTSAYRRSFFMPENSSCGVASVRAGNVIGGGDWSRDRLVPDLVQSFMSGERAIIRKPFAVRPWQHVLEPLTGYLMLAYHLYHDWHNFAEAWNFGPSDDDTRPVQWIAEQLTRRWGGKAGWYAGACEHGHEALTLRLDSGKARARLGWRPRLSLGQTLDFVVDWYKAYNRGRPMRDVTLDQIHSYTSIGGRGGES